MAQVASTLDDRPLPEANRLVVRSVLPVTPEAVVIAVDEQGCPRAGRVRRGNGASDYPIASFDEFGYTE